MAEQHSKGVLLSGLDGSSPLAFLAALGLLRVLATAYKDEDLPRLSWEPVGGIWRPWLSSFQNADDILARLTSVLVSDRSGHATSFVGDPQAISQFYAQARGGVLGAKGIDNWYASIANDVHRDATSQLQLTRRDYFSGNLDKILRDTRSEHLRKALFEEWRYDDGLDGRSLHLLPSEDRRHAYQWHQPNGDPTRKSSGNVLGANRLAIEAFPFFAGLPSTNPDRLRVTGWTGVRSDDSVWTWPVWVPVLPVHTVQSLLGRPDLVAEEPEAERLRAMGVGALYRCRRILVEQTPNLTPSICLWSMPEFAASSPAASAGTAASA